MFPIFSLMTTFTQWQLWYKVQKVPVLWACRLNDSKQNKQLAALSLALALSLLIVFLVVLNQKKIHYLRFVTT